MKTTTSIKLAFGLSLGLQAFAQQVHTDADAVTVHAAGDTR